MTGLTDLNGKVAVVTGGASGIGRGIAERLIVRGAHVVIADIEDGSLQQTAAQIGAVGVRTDVSDLGSVQSLADAALDRFGRIDIVCNNAGIGPMAKLIDTTMDDWKWMIDVNLWGVIHGVHVFLPLLLQNEEGGHIVNTASMGGLVVAPRLGSYNVSKFGVVALSEALALELEQDGSKVGVSILCPGPTRTNLESSSRNRPSGLQSGGLEDVSLSGSEIFKESLNWVSPSEVGDLVAQAVQQGDLYIITHPEQIARVQSRFERIEGAFRRAAYRDRPV